MKFTYMDLDCIDLADYHIVVLVGRQQMDLPNSLVGMNSLECDWIHRKWLAFRKCPGKDQYIYY